MTIAEIIRDRARAHRADIGEVTDTSYQDRPTVACRKSIARNALLAGFSRRAIAAALHVSASTLKSWRIFPPLQWHIDETGRPRLNKTPEGFTGPAYLSGRMRGKGYCEPV